jgi:ethanolamine ammonia-lyase small subunit
MTEGDGGSRDQGRDEAVAARLAGLREYARTVSPARVFTGSAGRGYRTADLLGLRADHAFARDAVEAKLELERPEIAPAAATHAMFMVETRVGSEDHLLRPDLGRRLSDEARERVRERCPAGTDLQVVVGDGLSADAVYTQVPHLLSPLFDGARGRGWTIGRPFAVRHCRVGVLNDVGELLDPLVVVLLIGERPGLSSSESLSAYVAYRPRADHRDADRNLISNIHAFGTPVEQAASRLLDLVAVVRTAGRSGVGIVEPDSTNQPTEEQSWPLPLPRPGPGAHGHFPAAD